MRVKLPKLKSAFDLFLLVFSLVMFIAVILVGLFFTKPEARQPTFYLLDKEVTTESRDLTTAKPETAKVKGISTNYLWEKVILFIYNILP